MYSAQMNSSIHFKFGIHEFYIDFLWKNINLAYIEIIFLNKSFFAMNVYLVFSLSFFLVPYFSPWEVVGPYAMGDGLVLHTCYPFNHPPFFFFF